MLKKQLWAIAVCSSLTVVGVNVTPQPAEAQAVQVPTTTTTISKAPYSRIFFTGAAYAVKDHDFEASNPSIGFSTVWLFNPAKDRFQVGVRYCLPDNSLAESGSSLTSMVLMNNNQPLATIDQRVMTTPAQQKILRASYYTSGYYRDGLGDPYWEDAEFYDGADPFWGDYLSYTAPTYVPATTCSIGSSRFDISQLTGAISQLPARTLQVKLIFSNGTTSQWRLGHETVQALKNLITLRQAPASVPQPVSTP